MTNPNNNPAYVPHVYCSHARECDYRGGKGAFKGEANRMLRSGPAFYILKEDVGSERPKLHCQFCVAKMRRENPDKILDFVPWSEWARLQLAAEVRRLTRIVSGETTPICTIVNGSGTHVISTPDEAERVAAAG